MAESRPRAWVSAHQKPAVPRASGCMSPPARDRRLERRDRRSTVLIAQSSGAAAAGAKPGLGSPGRRHHQACESRGPDGYQRAAEGPGERLALGGLSHQRPQHPGGCTRHTPISRRSSPASATSLPASPRECSACTGRRPLSATSPSADSRIGTPSPSSPAARSCAPPPWQPWPATQLTHRPTRPLRASLSTARGRPGHERRSPRSSTPSAPACLRSAAIGIKAERCAGN